MHVTHAELLIALGIVMAIAGGWLLWLTRRRVAALPRLELAGVGRVSPITWAVVALALIGMGYHVFVHAAGFAQFRAPMWLAGAVAAAAVFASLVVDALDNANAPTEPDDDREAHD